MAEEKTEHRRVEPTRRRRPLRWWAGVALLTAAVVTALLWLSERLTLRSAEQQLAAIEAASAIPDSENAAVNYSEVLASTDLASAQPAFLSRAGLRGPWLSADNPVPGQWLDTRQVAINRLLEASRKQNCQFPIPIGTPAWTEEMNLLSAARRWAQLLVSAANNDMAEGRIDDALQKSLSVIRMAAHFRQQPVMTSLLAGTAIEGLALYHIKSLIVQGDVGHKDLDIIRKAVSSTKDTWQQDMPTLIEVHRLIEETRLSLLARLKKILLSTDRKALERAGQIHLRILADRRGIHILTGLRRYKDLHGSWPQGLGVLRDSVEPEMLIDPISGGAFVYKLNENDFTLYSRGKNNIDENGSRTGRADDWLIWPPRSRGTQSRQAAQ